VKFLVDNQLPQALCRFLNDRRHECTHVLEVGLDEAKDPTIWQYACDNSAVLIAKDEDFLLYATRTDPGTAFVWVRLRNCRNAELIAAFERALPSILAALESGQHVVELR
jgi:predicted nuclease of predicted toxin-antitoxin system